jgi:hypothetical protein
VAVLRPAEVLRWARGVRGDSELRVSHRAQRLSVLAERDRPPLRDLRRPLIRPTAAT